MSKEGIGRRIEILPAEGCEEGARRTREAVNRLSRSEVFRPTTVELPRNDRVY